MNKEKTLEVFAEIAALLRSVRHEDPEYWQFNVVALGIISGKTLDWEEMEIALIALSNYRP
jgi:hypothetical protein